MLKHSPQTNIHIIGLVTLTCTYISGSDSPYSTHHNPSGSRNTVLHLFKVKRPQQNLVVQTFTYSTHSVVPTSWLYSTPCSKTQNIINYTQGGSINLNLIHLQLFQVVQVMKLCSTSTFNFKWFRCFHLTSTPTYQAPLINQDHPLLSMHYNSPT